MFHCSLQFNNDNSSKSHLKVCELILQQSTRGLIVLQPTRSELGPCEFPLSTIQLAQKVPVFSPAPRHKHLQSGKLVWRGDSSTLSKLLFLQSLLVALAPEAPLFFFFFFLRSIEQNTTTGGQVLYNIVLASATHQHKAATGTHRSPPS